MLWIKRIDYYFKNTNEIKSIKKALKQNNIILHEIPLITGRFPLNEKRTAFNDMQIKQKIRRIIKNNKIDIVHTRGYNAGLIVAKIKKMGIHFKHVFDPRSPYLTELQSTYNISEKSKEYIFWKENEKFIINNSDKVIAISKDFQKYLNCIKENTVYIPNNSNINNIDQIKMLSKTNRRKSICYVGSMGNGWNNINTYFDFMEKVYKFDKEIVFELYVLQSSYSSVYERSSKSIIPAENFIVKSLKPDEVNTTIAGSLAGMQIMEMKDSRLGIKTVDYLSSGVPIICNNNAMGASNLVKEEKIGWNIDEDKDLSKLVKTIESIDMSEKCIDFSYKNFSTDKVAEKYLETYKNLLN